MKPENAEGGTVGLDAIVGRSDLRKWTVHVAASAVTQQEANGTWFAWIPGYGGCAVGPADSEKAALLLAGALRCCMTPNAG